MLLNAFGTEEISTTKSRQSLRQNWKIVPSVQAVSTKKPAFVDYLHKLVLDLPYRRTNHTITFYCTSMHLYFVEIFDVNIGISIKGTSNNYTIGCPPVCGDNP